MHGKKRRSIIITLLLLSLLLTVPLLITLLRKPDNALPPIAGHAAPPQAGAPPSIPKQPDAGDDPVRSGTVAVVPAKTVTPVPTTSPDQGSDVPPPVLSGKVLYVSPNGNDGDDGSQAHPFATIQKAASQATPGTTVLVLPGTYTQPVMITKSGTATARIAFRSSVRWGAKVATTGTQDPWTTEADYIDIIGFDVTSTGSRDGIENRGSFIRTIGNHVHDIPGGNTCDDIGGSGIDDAVYTEHDDDIIGNVVDHIGSSYPQLCEYVHGIYHSTARGHIENNISYDNAGCGINLWHAATETIVTNNLVFGNEEHGISVGTNTDNTNGVKGDNFLVANNISIDNALLGIRERIGVGSHNQYIDNIVYGNGDKPFGDEEYDWPSAAGSRDINTITRPPQFVNFKADGSGDYHLTATSPGINAGTTEGAPSTDFEGTPRPEGGGIDVGPYEYPSKGCLLWGMPCQG
ncbi:MAG TPA: choice-of-anchor Q domain-containing protein [Ktedonobacteraceae bacterium]|jgi:hypothetical protein|nr:choice-of-anchor Q domain-containing protein [Ktedonobacteraceae bacterium]